MVDQPLKTDYNNTSNFTAANQNELNTRVNSHSAQLLTKYEKPIGGVPELDLVSDVQTALALARSALQPNGPSGGGPTVVAWDTGINGKPETFPPTAHTHTKDQVGLGNVDNVADADKGFSVAQANAIGDFFAQNAVSKAVFDSKGDIIIATGADTYAVIPIGTPGQVLTADPSTPIGVRWVTPAVSSGGGGTGGNDPRIVGTSFKLGDGRAAGQSYTYNHNLGTKSLWVTITDVATGEILLAKCIPNTSNTVIITPNVVWPLNSKRVRLLGFLGLVDETPPSAAPTLGYVSQTGKTVTVSVAGGADNVGVAGYNMFYDTGGAKTYAGSIGGPGNYVFSLPAYNTSYNLTATVYDAEGNESAYSTALPRSTPAAPMVSFVALGVGTDRITPGGASTAAMTKKITPNPGDSLVVFGTTSHNNWDLESSHTTTVTSDRTGTWTKVVFPAATDINPGGSQPSGSQWAFVCLNPQANVEHTVTQTLTDADINIAAVTMDLRSYANVAGYSNPVVVLTSGALSLDMPSVVGSMNVFSILKNGATIAGMNFTNRFGPVGSDVAGYGDYAQGGDAVGVAGNNTLTITGSALQTAIAFRLDKAA